MIHINPKLDKISKHFPEIALMQKVGDIKLLVNWFTINQEEFDFISNLVINRKIKTDLDNICFIYNYLKFIKRVSNSGYNEYAKVTHDHLRELLQLYTYIDNKGTFDKITLQDTTNNKKFIIEAGNGPSEVLKLFEYAMAQLPYWKRAMVLFSKLSDQGHLDYIRKKRRGNNTDYCGVVLGQIIDMFNDYLQEFTTTENLKEKSNFTLIGYLLANIGFIEKDSDFYKSKNEYYNTKAYDISYKVVSKRNKYAEDEKFPPGFLLLENLSLI